MINLRTTTENFVVVLVLNGAEQEKEIERKYRELGAYFFHHNIAKKHWKNIENYT